MSEFLDIPYAEADCRELARRVLASHGIELPTCPREARRAGWYPVDQARRLDVVMFSTPDGPHVGVVVARGQFLHADKDWGRSRIDRLSDPLWAAQLEGIYRHG